MNRYIMDLLDKLASWIAKQLDGLVAKTFMSAGQNEEYSTHKVKARGQTTIWGKNSIVCNNGTYYYNGEEIKETDPRYKKVKKELADAMKKLDKAMDKMNKSFSKFR